MRLSSPGITQTRLSSFVLVGVMSLLLFGRAIPAIADSPPTSTCTHADLTHAVGDATPGVTIQQALDFVRDTTDYSSAISGFSVPALGGATEGWTFNPNNCSVQWKSINLIFDLQSSNGTQYNLDITSNPSLGIVYGSSLAPVQVESGITAGCSGTCEWSGYGIANNAAGDTYQLYGSFDIYYVPQITAASGESCSTNWCTLSEWAGLSNSTDQTGCNPSCIVQGGTEEQLEGSTQYNDAWIEFWKDTSVNSGNAMICPSTDNVVNGDAIEPDVENEKAYNGNSGDDYYVFVWDNTQDWVCSISDVDSGHSYLAWNFTPYWADYMVEDPQDGTSGIYQLPSFAELDISNCELYNTAWNFAYSDYYNSYGQGFYMKNSGTQNTVTNSMNSASLFSVDYSSYTGT